jgi:hypothetical protein
MEKAKNTYHTVVGTIPKSNIKICIINDTFDNKMKKPKNITLSGKIDCTSSDVTLSP